MLWKGLFATIEVYRNFKPIWIRTVIKLEMILNYILPIILAIISKLVRKNEFS